MNIYEQNEISQLPIQYRPLGAWAYFGLTILFAIPILGFIFQVVFALSNSNINRRSFARSFFCIYIVAIAVVLIVVVVGGAGLGALSGILGQHS